MGRFSDGRAGGPGHKLPGTILSRACRRTGEDYLRDRACSKVGYCYPFEVFQGAPLFDGLCDTAPDDDAALPSGVEAQAERPSWGSRCFQVVLVIAVAVACVRGL